MYSQSTYNYRSANLRNRAGRAFEWLWFKGKIKAMLALVTRQSRLIPYLSHELIEQLQIEVEQIGLQPIRVSEIVGTLGRMNYDKDFNPLQHRDKKRWMSVAIAMMSSTTTLAPIAVVQFNGKYYASDGNHRVSVARYLDKLYLDANIVLWRSKLADNKDSV